MSTSTSHPPLLKEAEEATTSRSRYTLRDWLIILIVFVAGAASLSVEMTASRLLAPYFGSTQFVWASLIGLILLYLTVGYYLGGFLADRYPRSVMLYGLTTIASLLIIAIPFSSPPVLNWTIQLFANVVMGEFYGSLVVTLLLFTLPTILLGCVSPFAIRLLVEQVGKSGRVSGQLYAISTIGSILGTFLPVFVLLPDIGTSRTFIVSGATLLVFSLLGLLITRNRIA